MTNFLHWRKTTWALLLWSGTMVTWVLLAGSSGAAIVVLLWLVGTAGFCFLWFMTQPAFRQGRGYGNGLFARPGRGNWRVINLHRHF